MAASRQSDTDEFLAVIPQRDVGQMKVVSVSHYSFAIVGVSWMSECSRSPVLYECHNLFDV